MKYTKYIGMMFVAGSMLAAASCTDFSDYNSIAGDANPSADKTLWENISANDKLQNFAKILKKAGFDKVLSAPQFYTVWAPLDGTYDDEAVYQLDSATIVKQFAKQHIAEYNHLISGEEDSNVLTLNLKNHKFTNSQFGESEMNTPNYPAVNGVMHTLNGMDPFYNSIYEYIESMPDSKFRDYITKYDRLEIDEANSVLGPIVNGEQTYQHIEYRAVNDVIDDVLEAKLDNEDSVYTILAPNDHAWEASYARINPDFKYIKGMIYSDLNNSSEDRAMDLDATINKKTDDKVKDAEYLNDSLTSYNIVRNLVFSHGYKCNDKLNADDATELDTLYSVSRNHLPSAKSIQDHTVGDVKVMSNGYLREIDSLAFNSWDSFEPVIKGRDIVRNVGCKIGYESLNLRDIIKERSLNADPDAVLRDSIFANMPAYFYEDLLGNDRETFSYAKTTDLGRSTSPEFDFKLSNVLSTKYHIYVVMVPEQMDVPTSTLKKEYYLNFYMMYTDAKNKMQKKLLNLAADADESWGPRREIDEEEEMEHIVTKACMVNVIDLGEFEFPCCYYGTDAYPTLLFAHTQSFSTSSRRNKYEQAMRVARIYLIPAEYDKVIDKRLIKDIKK